MELSQRAPSRHARHIGTLGGRTVNRRSGGRRPIDTSREKDMLYTQVDGRRAAQGHGEGAMYIVRMDGVLMAVVETYSQASKKAMGYHNLLLEMADAGIMDRRDAFAVTYEIARVGMEEITRELRGGGL